MFDAIANAVSWLTSSSWGVWGWPTIVLILGAGIFMTVKLKGMQIRKLGESINSTIVPTVKAIGKKHAEDKTANSVSQFEAFSAAISGTVGTGNIVGVSAAILTGGPGAVFWMWVSALFGMITNYSENVLGLYFRKKDKAGNLSGGAFYYIQNGLGWKWLAYIAAIFCVCAAIGMSAVQTNKISGVITSAVGSSDLWIKLLIGAIVAVVAALIIIGGVKRIGKFASMTVPFMTLLFIALALITIAVHITDVPRVFGLIFKHAFNFEAVGGGILGYGFATVIQKGMARGVFSNEAGLGSSVIAHSASETREPVMQGLWGIFEVFLDTFVICTMTALMLLTSIDYESIYTAAMETGAKLGSLDSSTAVLAFSQQFGSFGNIAFCIILPLFAFTTIIAWSYYGEKATEFLFQKSEKGKKAAVFTFKLLYVVLIVAAAVISSTFVWDFSDMCNALMAFPNLVAVIGLSGLVVKITKNYYDRKKGLNVEPMLSAYPEQNVEFKKDLERKSA